MRMSGIELQQATGGSWHGGVPAWIDGIDTDSRHFTAGHAFLALRGPRFDGHSYAETVAGKASAMIGDAEGMRQWQAFRTPQLQVADTLKALGDIATAWRNRLTDTTVFAITGSYGKTTVRAMLAHVFASLGMKVAATEANLNNLIGVPMTLLNTAEASEVALIECGISEKGEMHRLSEIVRPDVAIITGITSAHGEGLGGLRGVASEKSRILSHLRNDGWYITGYGVRRQLQQTAQATAQPLLDMDHNEHAIVQWQMDRSTVTFRHADTHASLELALPARHWAADMALVATVALQHFHRKGRPFGLQEIVAALATWAPVGGRMQPIAGIHGCRLLDDSYNANPISMQAAIDTLRQLSGHRIAILGDMGELGDETVRAHACIHPDGIDRLLLIGPHMRHLADKYPQADWFADTDAALAWLEKHHDLFAPGSHVLVKGSRYMELDRVVCALRAKERADAV